MTRWNVLEKSLFGAFLFWAACGLVFTIWRIDLAAVAAWSAPRWLVGFVAFCLRTGDPLLILLGFANTHLAASRRWPAARARRWVLIVLSVALAVETLGTATSFPFGSYHYTDQFGPRLGVVPFIIPLAWYLVVTNSLLLVRDFAGLRLRWMEAALAGVLCTAYVFVLEPFATVTKSYWLWQDGRVPWQNYLAWFVISTALVGFFAPPTTVTSRTDPRPAAILGLTLLIFLAGRWS